MRIRAWLTQAVACPVPPRRHGGTTLIDNDFRQRDLGPLRTAAEAAELGQAVTGLAGIGGCRLAGSDPLAPLAWLVTGHGGTEAGR